MKTLALVRSIFFHVTLSTLCLNGAAPKHFRVDGPKAPEIKIDIPVKLSKVRAVFNMDHAAFQGDMPVGLGLMTLMVSRYDDMGADWKITAIFHGEAGYMVLDDEAYDRVRKTKTGNPYKTTIAALMKNGVGFEMCVVTMQVNRWGNADLLPGVKVNGGAIGRLIELVQQGYVQLQP
jgi:intracellular sulfur oxidation DsrE/DsrF family protein